MLAETRGRAVIEEICDHAIIVVEIHARQFAAFDISTAYIIADTEVADMAFGGVVNRPVSNCREQMLTIIDMVYIDGILSF